MERIHLKCIKKFEGETSIKKKSSALANIKNTPELKLVPYMHICVSTLLTA